MNMNTTTTKYPKYSLITPQKKQKKNSTGYTTNQTFYPKKQQNSLKISKKTSTKQ